MPIMASSNPHINYNARLASNQVSHTPSTQQTIPDGVQQISASQHVSNQDTQNQRNVGGENLQLRRKVHTELPNTSSGHDDDLIPPTPSPTPRGDEVDFNDVPAIMLLHQKKHLKGQTYALGILNLAHTYADHYNATFAQHSKIICVRCEITFYNDERESQLDTQDSNNFIAVGGKPSQEKVKYTSPENGISSSKDGPTQSVPTTPPSLTPIVHYDRDSAEHDPHQVVYN
ncbi:unnamed protein product [Orchesella dallaii]|uniref:Uncharacterized protein n=1 Tax=Orchesella dallaii TaxID=48710 RepID=A0ABP1R603_9HEXA